MATIADKLGDKAQEVRRAVGAPTVLPQAAPNAALRMHAIAAASGLEGCPLKRDSNGRLRSRGRFVSVQ